MDGQPAGIDNREQLGVAAAGFHGLLDQALSTFETTYHGQGIYPKSLL